MFNSTSIHPERTKSSPSSPKESPISKKPTLQERLTGASPLKQRNVPSWGKKNTREMKVSITPPVHNNKKSNGIMSGSTILQAKKFLTQDKKAKSDVPAKISRFTLSDNTYESEFHAAANKENIINNSLNNTVTTREIASLFKKVESMPIEAIKKIPQYFKVLSGLCQNPNEASNILTIITSPISTDDTKVIKKIDFMQQYKALQYTLLGDLQTALTTLYFFEKPHKITDIEKFASSLSQEERKIALTVIDAHPVRERALAINYLRNILVLLNEGKQKQLELIKKVYNPSINTLSEAEKNEVIETIEIILKAHDLPRVDKRYLEAQLANLQSSIEQTALNNAFQELSLQDKLSLPITFQPENLFFLNKFFEKEANIENLSTLNEEQQKIVLGAFEAFTKAEDHADLQELFKNPNFHDMFSMLLIATNIKMLSDMLPSILQNYGKDHNDYTSVISDPNYIPLKTRLMNDLYSDLAAQAAALPSTAFQPEHLLFLTAFFKQNADIESLIVLIPEQQELILSAFDAFNRRKEYPELQELFENQNFHDMFSMLLVAANDNRSPSKLPPILQNYGKDHPDYESTVSHIPLDTYRTNDTFLNEFFRQEANIQDLIALDLEEQERIFSTFNVFTKNKEYPELQGLFKNANFLDMFSMVLIAANDKVVSNILPSVLRKYGKNHPDYQNIKAIDSSNNDLLQHRVAESLLKTSD